MIIIDIDGQYLAFHDLYKSFSFISIQHLHYSVDDSQTVHQQITNTMANQASVIPAPKANVELQDVEKYTPGPNEVLVKVRSIGFSPIEAKVQRYTSPSLLCINYPRNT